MTGTLFRTGAVSMSGTINAPAVSSNAVPAAVPAAKDAASTATAFLWVAPIAAAAEHAARSSDALQVADARQEA